MNNHARLEIQRSIAPPNCWHWAVIVQGRHIYACSNAWYDDLQMCADDAAGAGADALREAEMALQKLGRDPAPPTKHEIADRLDVLANDMETIGAAMDYYGGLAEWAQHGREMIGAAAIARQWIVEINKGRQAEAVITAPLITSTTRDHS